MGNFVLLFLNRSGAGLPISAAVALIRGGSPRAGRVGGAAWPALVVYVLLAAAGLLAPGSVWHLVHVGHVRDRFSPPGELRDVSGHREHAHAKAEVGRRPAIVRMPGALAGGFTRHRRHRALREEARSILVDRPATGRSDTGPFPRTTVGQIGELLAALYAAPENGLFVLIGHTCGTGNGEVS